MQNIILNVDSYKCSHFLQYPEGTEYVYSYIESRGGKFDRTLFFGLQGFIQEYLNKPFTQEDIDFAEKIVVAHGLQFNRAGWEYILKEHKGFLPLRICAVREGLVVPVSHPLVTIVNTDPKCGWLTSYMETALLRAVWYPTTVATQSYEIKQVILANLEKTGDPAGIGFKLHDFGGRGVSSFESAEIGTAAHLVNFMGTDTFSGILWAMKHYNTDVCGFSIPAAEHSTLTSWTRSGEVDAYRNMVKQFGEKGLTFAVVSDSYDVYNAVENIWGDELKGEVEKCGGCLVIRPDSGDPVEVNSVLISILGEKFGYTVNEKGYKVLPSCVRLIQGDGVTLETIQDILGTFKAMGWSGDNITFGMGGQLLQGVTRDTQKFAMKCSAIKVNGEWREVYKDPITDSGKRSKRGLVRTEYLPSVGFGVYQTANDDTYSPFDCMYVVYSNGFNMGTQTFDQIRALSNVKI